MRLALFLLMVISALGAGLLASMFSTSTEGLILLLALLILIFSSLTILIRYRQYGGNDPLLLFSFFFAFYNGPFLLQVSWSLSKGIPPSPIFPVNFAPEAYLKAAFASFLAAIALFNSTLFLELTRKRNQAKVIKSSIPPTWIGIIAFLSGILLFFVDFQRIGGFFYALSLPRDIRLNLLAKARGSLPYAPFVFAGLALVWLAYGYRRLNRVWAYGLLVIWILLMLIQGDRRFLTYGVLIAFAAYTSVRYPKLRVRPKLVVVLLLLFMAFSFFAQFRGLLQPVITGRMSFREAVGWIYQNASLGWLLPGVNEPAGPYFTLLYSIEYSFPIESALLGVSYLQAIPNLLPRSLYPGDKPLELSFTFANLIHQRYMSGQEGVIGWGYSPVAEAYNNFGLCGVFIPFFLIGLLWGWVTRLKSGNWMGILVYALLMPQVLNLNRTTVAWSLQEVIYFLGAGLMVIVTRAILLGAKASKPKGALQTAKWKTILFLITGLAYGGAETQVVRLATQLKEKGWEVRVVSLMPLRAYVEELKASEIPLVSLGIRRKFPDPRPILRLVRLIRSWRPQIVHSHMVHANLLARLVRPLAPVPVLICTAHNIDEKGRRGSGRLREIAYRLTDPLCDLTTQVSRAGLERYVQVRAVPRHKIRFIPNGVDVERFYPDASIGRKMRASLGLAESVFVWLAVGRFEEAKDYPNMLRAFAQASKKRETALFIAGQGSMQKGMEDLARDLGIASDVRFLGVRRDVPDLMRAADGYVMSSAWEGMPMVLLEAAASGLPIVATDVGGNSEVVIDGKTGFLVPPKDPEALAQAMLRLMNLPEQERRRMGEAARQYIEANFSLDQVVDQWEALYREFLARKGVWAE